MMIASVLLSSACTPASRLGVPAEAGNSEVTWGSFQVIPVRGTLVEAEGKIDARLDSFASPFSAAHSSAELYVSGFPTEEFDAEVIDVVPLRDGWYTATARLRTADARLHRSAAIEGRLFVAVDKSQSTPSKSGP